MSELLCSHCSNSLSELRAVTSGRFSGADGGSYYFTKVKYNECGYEDEKDRS